MKTLYPSQIGTIESGSYAAHPSQLVFGRDVSAATSRDVGFGQGGRPDFIERVTIFLTKNNSSDKTVNSNLTAYATVTINVEDLVSIVTSNPNAGAALNLTLKEVDVCDAGVAKKMIILAGPTYSP